MCIMLRGLNDIPPRISEYPWLSEYAKSAEKFTVSLGWWNLHINELMILTEGRPVTNVV